MLLHGSFDCAEVLQITDWAERLDKHLEQMKEQGDDDLSLTFVCISDTVHFSTHACHLLLS